MTMKFVLTLPSKFSLLIAGTLVAAMCCAAVPEALGDYVSLDGRLSIMQIRRANGHLRIVLNGGASATDTDNAAADCEAVAEGELSGAVVRARLVPFEGELNSLKASEIAKMNPVVLVEIDKTMAVVRGSFPYCGLRNSLAGKYKRVGLPTAGVARGGWQQSPDGEAGRTLQLVLHSKQAGGFDQGKVIANQTFFNRDLDSHLAGAIIWNSRYPGVSKCVLVSKNSGAPVLLFPPEPDPDLPLSCTGEIAISFPGNARVLVLFAYESPSRASIYYPLVLEIKNRHMVIDLASTDSANKARDDGAKLQSVADLKRILDGRRGRK